MRLFDKTGEFLTPTAGDGLKHLAVRGAGVTVFSQGFLFAVQMISTMILARLLTPADFGIVTMVTTFSVLLASCGQVGFPDAVRQADHISHVLASNLFWINTGIGFLLMVVFAATGRLLASFYHDARIVPIVLGVSLTIFLNNTSVLHTALLSRAMRFSAACAIDNVARVTSVALSVALAWKGMGYWALIAGAICFPLAQTVGAFLVCGWIPALPRREARTRSMVTYAAQVFGRYSVYYSTRNADNLLVGWQFGSGILGVYKKAYDLFILPFSLLQIYSVAVSTLSRLKNNRAEYQRYFLSGLALLAVVSMGAAAVLTIAGRDLTLLVLGRQWDRAGRIFTLFAPGIGVMMIYMTYGVIHLSLGTPGRFFRWTVLEFVTTLVLFVGGLHWGPEGVAVAWNVSFCLLLIPAFRYAGRPIKLGIAQVLGAIWRPTLAAGLAGAASAIVLSWNFLPGSDRTLDVLVRTVLKCLLFFAMYAGAITLVHGSPAPLLRLWRLLREMIPFGGANVQGAASNRLPVAAKSQPAI